MNYWNYQKVLNIRFIWSNENVHIIDNEDNRKVLSKNMYNLT